MTALVSTGLQALLSSARPAFAWDARQAGRAIGAEAAGTGRMSVTLTDEDGYTTAGWYYNVWDDGLKKIRTITMDTDREQVLGSNGEFTDGYLSNSMGSSVATAKHGLAVVSPTVAGALITHATDYPDILYNSSAWHCKVTQLDTSLDGTNAVVIEKAQARSSTYARCFQLLVRNDDRASSPDGNIELGWNTTAGTRTTSVPVCRALPGSGESGWFAVSIVVAANATTAGYISVKAAPGTGTWHIAYPLWYSIWSTMERVTRLAGPINSTSNNRGQWQVHTTAAELALRPTGWFAAAVVLPDRSVSYGHTDFSGASNYRFLGLANLDCGTYRMRLSMSDTYDHLVLSLGTTAGVNFAFLDAPADWPDFGAFGIVGTWDQINQSKYATLYVNGVRTDAVADPADWFPSNSTPGTLYLGVSTAAGTAAEAWISRVAYGRSHMRRATARALSRHLQTLCRGGTIE